MQPSAFLLDFKALSALRGVLREAWRLGLMAAEDLARASDIEPVRDSTPLRGRALAANEVAALFHVCIEDRAPAGPRDAVILALGVAAGGRPRSAGGSSAGSP